MASVNDIKYKMLYDITLNCCVDILSQSDNSPVDSWKR